MVKNITLQVLSDALTGLARRDSSPIPSDRIDTLRDTLPSLANDQEWTLAEMALSSTRDFGRIESAISRALASQAGRVKLDAGVFLVDFASWLVPIGCRAAG